MRSSCSSRAWTCPPARLCARAAAPAARPRPLPCATPPIRRTSSAICSWACAHPLRGAHGPLRRRDRGGLPRPSPAACARPAGDRAPGPWRPPRPRRRRRRGAWRRRPLQSARGLLQSRRRLLAREALEAAAPALPSASASWRWGRRRLRPCWPGRRTGAALPLAFLLLALGQLPQPLQSPRPPGRRACCCWPRWTVSYWFFSLSSSSSNRSASSSAFVPWPPPSPPLPEAHLHLAEGGLRPLQVLQRALLGSERPFAFAAWSSPRAAAISTCGRAQRIRGLGEAASPAPPRRGSPSAGSGTHLVLEPALHQRQRRQSSPDLLGLRAARGRARS